MSQLDTQADVLVIGGGMAGAWAALGAARESAQVTLVDKGYCGTSGVTASAGPGHWWVPPEARDEVVRQRAVVGQGLNEPAWMHRILDTTWRNLPTIAPQYEFSIDRSGQPAYRGVRGPEYLRALRAQLDLAGVRVLDHHPALELLQHDDGSVAGARGLRLRGSAGSDEWTLRAGAVVMATGGCAFLSKLLGADNNTGDGYLMAAEAGAELSGMEFSNYYTVAPKHSSMTRSMSYVFADYFDAAGRELPIPGGHASVNAIARALLEGPVFCTLARMPQDLRDALPTISPNVMLPFTRRGIDPFTDRFEITLRGEGTVRGIGGLRVASRDCESTVRNLFVAGDAATRELVAGAVSGGGNINSAWALSSGLWAGRAAAWRWRHEGRRVAGSVRPAGQAGLRPSRTAQPLDRQETVVAVQRSVLAVDRNIFRSGPALAASLAEFDERWHEVSRGAQGASAIDTLRTRETAAMLATARWSVSSALQRSESRGMHQRTDAPQTEPTLAHRIVVGGLESVWHRHEVAGQHPAETADSTAPTEASFA